MEERYQEILRKNILITSKTIDGISDRMALKIAMIVAPHSEKLHFEKVMNEVMEEVGAVLEQSSKAILKAIEESIIAAVALSNRKQDKLLMDALKLTGATVIGLSVAKAFCRKLPPSKMPPFKFRLRVNEVVGFEPLHEVSREIMVSRVGPLKLSDRVWNLKEGNLELIEHCLKNGFAKGKPAVVLAKELKQYLREPNSLFRRIRNEDGKLVLSNPAKNYHPGRGVYRSSHQNALRLAADYTNRAYRLNDHFRMKANPVVVGFEVKISGQHPKKDICDDLKGRYPKDFLFSGWHSRCFCYQVPIMLSDAEFDKYLDSIGEDKPFKTESTNQVKEVPDGFKNWVVDNRERIKGMKSRPWFLDDNESIVDNLNKQP